MKILLTSPYQRKLQGQYFYVKALKSLGHSVEIFWYNQLFRNNIQPNNKIGIKAIKLINNIRLKNKAKSFMPDVLLLNTGADIIKPITIKFIKSLGCKTTLFSGDSPIRLLNTAYETKYLKYFDAVFVSDDKHKAEWQSLGAKLVINLPIFGIDPDFHKPSILKDNKLSADVSFVGSLFEDRQNKLIKIIKGLPRNIDIKIWGHIYPEAPLNDFLIPYYHGSAWEKKFIKIFSNSKISLNFSPLHMGSGGNMRTFEIPACKSVQLVDRINPNWYIPGKEVITFNTPNDAAKKILNLLKNGKKRKSISKAGYKRTIKDHTYKTVFSKYIKVVNSI